MSAHKGGHLASPGQLGLGYGVVSPLQRFFHPVLAAKKLGKEPVGVQVAGDSFVLFRDGTGRAAALVDACPHRLAPLSAGRVRPDGRLQCRYHGWHFDAEGRGVSPSQPSLRKCDATPMQLVERDGYLWLGGTSLDRSAIPATRFDGYTPSGSFSVLFEAPLHVALDNFSEDEHTPWVHTRLGWTESDVDTIAYQANNYDDRTEVSYRARQRDTRFGPLIGLKRGDTFHNSWVTRFDPVRTIYDIAWTDPKTGATRGVETRTSIYMVPQDDTRTMFHVFTNVKLTKRRYRLIAPVVKLAAYGLGWWEIRDDAKFIPTVAQTPFEMKGMRLGKYDKPLIHNHKLLRRIYWDDDGSVGELHTLRRL